MNALIEKSIHGAVRDLAQRIADEHGIVINHVSFDWLDLSTASKHFFLVNGVELNTTTKEQK